MTFNNPDAPATKKQLWLLHILTKEDTRDLKLTIKEASDKIAQLKDNGHKPASNGKGKPKQRYYLLSVYKPSRHRMSNGKYKVVCFYHCDSYNKARHQFNVTKDQREYTFNLDLYAHVFAKAKTVTFIKHQLADGNFTDNSQWLKILEVDYCGEVMPINK